MKMIDFGRNFFTKTNLDLVDNIIFDGLMNFSLWLNVSLWSFWSILGVVLVKPKIFAKIKSQGLEFRPVPYFLMRNPRKIVKR
jgi:hypothetical protein